MQNKLYTIQFFSPPNDQFAAQKNFGLLAKRVFKLLEIKKPNTFLPPAKSSHKLSMTSTVWNISIGQLGYLYGYDLSQLLHTSSLAEYEKLEKVLD